MRIAGHAANAELAVASRSTAGGCDGLFGAQVISCIAGVALSAATATLAQVAHPANRGIAGDRGTIPHGTCT